jgi:hypothetical protein
VDYKIDARDAMDAFYGAGSWSYRTAAHTGSDLGAALNAAMTASRVSYPRLDVLIPPTGPWYMSTPITNSLVTGCHIHGDGGPFGTSIFFDSDANCFNVLYTGDSFEGGRIENLMVTLEDGHPNGGTFTVLAAQDNTGAPCGYIFDSLRCGATGNSSWAYGFVATGVNRTNPQGIRGLTVRNSIFFGTRLGGLWSVGIDQVALDNLGFAVPTTATGSDITIGGGGTPQTNSLNVYTNGLVTVGKIILGNVSSIVGNMKSGGLTVDSSVLHAGLIHDGPVTGAVGGGFVTSI